MNTNVITAVGIDVSKGKSMVAARCPGGVVVLPPFCVKHDAKGLQTLVEKLKNFDSKVRDLIHMG